jgi:hypothetical protein
MVALDGLREHICRVVFPTHKLKLKRLLYIQLADVVVPHVNVL